MNEKLKELAEQAGLGVIRNKDWHPLPTGFKHIERFAQLVRDDERKKCAADYLQDCCDAVDAARLEEREACAVLCDEWFASTAGQAIRARGEK